MKSGQLSAAVSALKEKGVLSSHRIERKEVGPAGAFDALTDYELGAIGFDADAALGLTPDAGSDSMH